MQNDGESKWVNRHDRFQAALSYILDFGMGIFIEIEIIFVLREYFGGKFVGNAGKVKGDQDA